MTIIEKLQKTWPENEAFGPVTAAQRKLIQDAAEKMKALVEASKGALLICEYVLSKPDAYDEEFGQIARARADALRTALRNISGGDDDD